MRPINADALLHELNNSHFPGAPYVDAGISIAIGKVCDAPTIDVAPVVRCKYCKYYDEFMYGKSLTTLCKKFAIIVKEDDFCSFMDRKCNLFEDGGNND